MCDKKKGHELFPPQLAAPSPTDPLGSYTGVPEDKDEMPEQDADDL